MKQPENYTGTTNDSFEPLQRTFEENFSEHNELGASVVVFQNGERVADLHAGWLDEEKETPWNKHSVACTMSAVKGPTSICLHLLMDQGHLRLDQPVADIWPEFAKKNKSSITVKDILTHRAGLPSLPSAPAGCAYNWDVIISAIEDHELIPEAIGVPAYHAHTFGYIAGEIIRRCSGMKPSDYFREQISEPFEIDYELRWRDQFFGRTADLAPPFIPPPRDVHSLAPLFEAMFCGDDWRPKLSYIFVPYLDTSHEAWRQAENPAAFGYGSAMGLSKLYAILAQGGELNGRRLLSENIVSKLSEEIWHGRELTTNGHWRYGLGFMQQTPNLMPCGPDGFGHPGNGGAMGFANPSLRLSFAYVMNRRHVSTEGMAACGPRALRLAETAIELASNQVAH